MHVCSCPGGRRANGCSCSRCVFRPGGRRDIAVGLVGEVDSVVERYRMRRNHDPRDGEGGERENDDASGTASRCGWHVSIESQMAAICASCDLVTNAGPAVYPCVMAPALETWDPVGRCG